ncbi:hypothetical protein BCON_0190g00090 [Botryotinia convoluta]|uniref:Uncharacterized protein n=1 Tax=Botryotinia convoluta TaxID=54673 RepID=A0A4Z1HZW5_9HELO|nr:hypothetical protein BCON_0190g00090 [Botryotinia convoluta]
MQNKAGLGLRLPTTKLGSPRGLHNSLHQPADQMVSVKPLELGVVASQHPSADSNSVSAAAMIVDSNADDTSPVVWVHNNGLGSDEENNGAIQQIGHWQGFSPPNDLKDALEATDWGILRFAQVLQVATPKEANSTPFIHHDTLHYFSM